MSTPDVDPLIDEQGQAWLDAAEAIRSGDRDRATHLLMGSYTDDLVVLFTRSVTQCILGSALCAVELAKVNGITIGSEDGFWGLDIGASEDPSAVTAMRCVTAAANGDFDTVSGLVQALQDDDPTASMRRLSSLAADLLGIFVAITGGAA